MAQPTAEKITLKVGQAEFRFQVTGLAFNSFQNAFMPDSKVAPANNFLMETIHPDDKAALLPYLEKYAIDLANAVAEQYKPKLDISVKK